MSRLSFDDILNPSSGLGSSAMRAASKGRTASMPSDEVASFDNTFKQAVDELRPRKNTDADDERDVAVKSSDESNRASDDEKADRTASDPEKVERHKKDSKKSEDKASVDAAESSDDSEDQDDHDEDALIAMVMAAAQEQATATDSDGEVAEVIAGVEGEQEGGVLENAAFDSDQNLPDPGTLTQQIEVPEGDEEIAQETLESTAEPSSEELGVSVETAESLTDVAPSEVVVSQETSTTETTSVSTAQGEGATSGAGVTEGSANQQGESNMDQGSNSEGGDDAQQEVLAPENAQASMANAASGQDEESVDQSTDVKKDTADVAVKTETMVDRPTTSTTETRVGHGQETSSNPQQTNETTLDTTDRVRFVERVAQAFQAQSAENRALRIRLHPEELGEIKLEVTVRNGQMHAKIETETREARNILMENLPALRERLASHDIKVQQFDIDYNAGGDQQGTPHSPDDWSNSGQNGSNRSSSDGPGATEEADAQSDAVRPRAVSLTGSGEQLDMTA